jgi:hypothetical protein
MNWQRNPEVKTTILPDGHVALSTEKTEWVHILNPVGALVWELSDGALSTEEIITQISELIQSTDRTALEKDVQHFTKELIDAGVLSSERKPTS